MAEIDLTRIRRIDVRDLAEIAGIDLGHGEAVLQLQSIKVSAPQILQSREPPGLGAIKKEVEKINAAAARFLASTLDVTGVALTAMASRNGEFDEITALERESELYKVYFDAVTLITRLETESRGIEIATMPGPAPSLRKRQLVEGCARFFEEYSTFTVSAAERSRFSRFVHLLFDQAGHGQDVSRIIHDVVEARRGEIGYK